MENNEQPSRLIPSGQINSKSFFTELIQKADVPGTGSIVILSQFDQDESECEIIANKVSADDIVSASIMFAEWAAGVFHQMGSEAGAKVSLASVQNAMIKSIRAQFDDALVKHMMPKIEKGYKDGTVQGSGKKGTKRRD